MRTLKPLDSPRDALLTVLFVGALLAISFAIGEGWTAAIAVAVAFVVSLVSWLVGRVRPTSRR